MWNKIERTFALAIFFRFLDCRTHLLLSIVPANAQKSSLEIRRNFMRAAWRLRECKFPLWHTWNCYEHKVHCFRFILSINFIIFGSNQKLLKYSYLKFESRMEKMVFFWILQNAKSTLHLENMTVEKFLKFVFYRKNAFFQVCRSF